MTFYRCPACTREFDKVLQTIERFKQARCDKGLDEDAPMFSDVCPHCRCELFYPEFCCVGPRQQERAA